MLKSAKERLFAMIKKIKELMIKYRELIVYLIVGVLTTIVSWAAYGISKFFLDVETSEFQMQVAVVIRWIAGVLFGYFANRKYVFMSKNPKILKEFASFTTARLITLFMDMFIMWLLPPIFWKWKVPYADWLATFVAAVVVTIMNYIFSKLMVFRKKKTS